MTWLHPPASPLARLSGNRVLTQDGDGAQSLTLLDLGLFLPMAICIHNP